MAGSVSIGEVSRRAGVPASTLRYYESAGILPGPERVSGRRRYQEEVVQRLALIQLAQRAGFTLGEIHELFGDFTDPIRISRRWREMATRKLGEIESSIGRLEDMKALLEEGLRCRCLTLEDCTIFTNHSAALAGNHSLSSGPRSSQRVPGEPERSVRPRRERSSLRNSSGTRSSA